MKNQTNLKFGKHQKVGILTTDESSLVCESGESESNIQPLSQSDRATLDIPSKSLAFMHSPFYFIPLFVIYILSSLYIQFSSLFQPTQSKSKPEID